MNQPITDRAIASVAFEGLFRAVSRLETSAIEKTNQDYRDWCAEVFPEDRVDIVCGKLEMTDTEIRWIALEVLHQEVEQALENGIPLHSDVDDDNLVSALSDNGFCPAFQDDLRELCREILKSWKSEEKTA